MKQKINLLSRMGMMDTPPCLRVNGSSKFLKSLILLFVLMLGVGNVWGGTEDAVYTLTCTKSGSNSGYGLYYDISVNGIGWKAPGNQTVGNYFCLGGKSSTALSLYLYSKTAISSDANVTKIELNHGTKTAGDVGDIRLDVYSTAAKAATGGDGDITANMTTGYVDNGKSTFTNSSADWKGRFYRISYSINPNNTSKNKYVVLNSVVFYKGGGTTPTLTTSGDAISNNTIAFGSQETSTKGTKTFTLSGSNLTANVSLAISGTNAAMFTVEPTSVTPVEKSITGQTITVNYTPTTAGSHTAKLTISSDGATSKELTLNGTGTAPVQKHTVTWSVNNVESKEQVAEGSVITFSTPTENIPTGKVFTGWAASQISGTQATAPTYVTSATMGTKDVTYYAVFATATSGESSWNQITTLDGIVDGTYVIKNGSYILPNAENTSSAPTGVSSPTVKDGVMTGKVESSMQWLFTSTGTAHQFNIKNASEKCLYELKDNNGVRVGTTSDKWTFAEYTTGYFSMQGANNSRYCATYNNSGSVSWRSYTTRNATNYNNNSGKIELYKLSGGTTYSDYCTSVTTKAVKTVAVKSWTTKKAFYAVGETLDLSGLTLTITYDDNSTEDITSGYTSTPSASTELQTTHTSVIFTYKNVDSEAQAIVVAAPVATPVISLTAGTYDGAQTASISCETAGATIYYTTDGNEPTSSSCVYSSALTIDESMTLKAIAMKTNTPNSTIASAAYTINYAVAAAGAITNGTVTPSVTKQEKGKTVTLTVAPGTGYQLSGLPVVKGADQSSISVSGSGTSYSFTMPKQNVTYTAAFTPIVASSVAISGANTVKVGKNITLTAATTPAGALVTSPVWKSSDETVATVDATGKVTGVKAGNVNITYEFTNAESTKITSANHAVEVKELVVMKFEEITNATSLNADDVVLFVKSDKTKANGALTSDNYLQEVTISNIAAVEEDVLPLILGGSEGAWTFSNGNGGYLSIKNGGSNNTLAWDGDNKYWTISANNSNCTITNNAYTGSSDKKYIKYNSRFSNYASSVGSNFKLYRQVVSSTVNVVSADNTKGSVALYDEDFEEEQTIGAKYAQGTKLGLYAEAKDGYEFVNWTLSDDNGGASLDDATSSMTVLTVGGKAVTATANFGLKKYDITLTQPQTKATPKVKIATISAKVNDEEVTKACAGTSVTLSYDPATLIEGYEFAEWTVFNTSTLEELTVTDNAFEMIGANVTVEAVFTEKEKFTVTVASEDESKGAAGFEGESGSAVVFYKDATPTIFAMAEEGYTFKNWTLNDGAQTTIADATSAETTITVKDEATITAHFEAAAAKTLTWYVNGTTTSGLKTVGSNITFEEPSGIPTGKVFVGWSENAIDGVQQSSPSIVTEATMPNADKTYYAVMATKEEGKATYTKLTTTSGYTGKTYVLGAEYNSTLYLFNDYEDNITSNISWGKCSSTAAPLEFSLSGAATQLVAKLKNADVYLQGLETGKFRMNSSEQKVYLVSGGKIYKAANGYELHYNDNGGNGGLRWYSNGSSTGVSAYFYEKTVGPTTYSDYCTFVKTVASVIISGAPTKTTYGVGDVFDKTGIVVKAKYNDNSETTITTDPEVEWNIQPATFTTKGDNVEVSVKVTYKSIESETKNYYVTVSKKTLTLTFYEGLEDITQKQVYHDADAFKLFVETPIGYNGALSYESSETSIATVAQEDDGWYVTPKAAGQTIITVTGEETDTYNSGTATLKVIVVQHMLDPTFAFSKSSVTANLGEAFTAPTLNMSSDLTTANISWNSSKESVATVDNAGVVTIVGLGTTTITASFSGDSKYNAAVAQYTLKVNDPNADVITATFLGASTKGYAAFEEVTSTTNNITYNGSCMKNSDDDIQIKKGSTGGIVVSSSDKIATRIELTFGSTSSNNVEVYGKNTPYTDHSDLQDETKRGTLLYTFVDSESTEPVIFELPKGYMYIAFQSAKNAAYIQQISISWKEPDDNRSNVTNTIGTICLAKEVKRGEYAGATFYEGDYVLMNGSDPYKYYLTEVDHLEAGYPYVFVKDQDATAIYWAETGEAVTKAESKNGLVGTLTGITTWESDGTNALTGNYMVVGNLFCECGVWCGLNANRAYLNLEDAPKEYTEQPAPVGVRRLVLTNQATDTPTVLDYLSEDGVDANAAAKKLVIDNQMFIIRGGKMYNAAGALVK